MRGVPQAVDLSFRLIHILAAMGIDVLNPIQWRCGNWDLDWLKDEYGQELCFHGGNDNHYTLPFGTEEEATAKVNRIKRTLAGRRIRLGIQAYLGPAVRVLNQKTPISRSFPMGGEGLEPTASSL